MTKYQVAPVPRIRLTKQQVECLRTLMHHVIEDLSYGTGGTFSKAGTNNTEINEAEVKRAKEALQFIALLIENKLI